MTVIKFLGKSAKGITCWLSSLFDKVVLNFLSELFKSFILPFSAIDDAKIKFQYLFLFLLIIIIVKLFRHKTSDQVDCLLN